MIRTYNFQKQFKELILNGSKKQTIRKSRKRETKPDDVLHLYTGMRTKQCQLIAKATCENVIPILIFPFQKRLVANITTDIFQFAQDDGFENIDDFYEFFQQYGEEKLNMEIIYWKLI